MKQMIAKSLVVAGAALALAGCRTCSTANVHPDSSDWTPVFDRTLSNAEFKPGTWTYEADGCLVPKTGDSIFSKADYENFVVDLEYAMGNPDGTRVPKWHEGFPALSTIPTHGRIGFQGVHGETGVRIKYIRVKSL